MATFNATFQTSEEIAVAFSDGDSLDVNFESVIEKYPEDADMESADLLEGKKGYGKDGEIIGTMPNNGDVSGEINTADGSVIISAGYASGGAVTISNAEKEKLISDNLKSGIVLLGIAGSPTVQDVADTTATAADVKSGKKIYLANGSAAIGSYLWDWMGDEAECIDDNVHSFSATLDNTDYATWTPSTTAKVIVESENKTARAIDTGNYDYLLRWRFTADIEYTSGVTKKAIPIRQAIEIYQAIIKRPSSLANLQIPTFTANGCITLFTAPVIEYYNTSGTLTMTFTGSYGFYPSAVAATFSNSTSDTPNLTIKTPTISSRCNSSYFAIARGAYVDQENSTIKLKGDLWRMKRGNAAEKMYESAVNLYNNPLT